MQVFAISGYSGTGKTALVETLVKELVRMGSSVATIKSGKHKLDGQESERGKDTSRHIEAGASITLYFGPDHEGTDLREVIGERHLATVSKYDFLLIEGMKSVDVPRFWCIGDSDLVLDEVPVNTQAIVVWSERPNLISDLPLVLAKDMKTLVKILRERAIVLR